MKSLSHLRTKSSMQLLRPLPSDPARHFWRQGDDTQVSEMMGEEAVPRPGARGAEVLMRLRSHMSRGGRLTVPAALQLLEAARGLFAEEPNLLYLPSPMHMFGDVHGQYFDLLNVLDFLELPAPSKRMLLLGDYVDRGMFSTETMLYLCACKILCPDSVFLLRGNHESRVMSEAMTFRKEVLHKYDEATYLAFQRLFDSLPLAAVITGTPYGDIFCVHGGIGPQLKKLSDIDAIDRFCEIPVEGLMCDLVWSDPVAAWDPDSPDFAYTTRGEWLDMTFAPNTNRNVSVVYGLRAVRAFLEENKLAFIVRGHQVQKSGFERHFTYMSDIPRVFTLFGCPNYCDLYGNFGAYMRVCDSSVGVQQYQPVPHPCVLPDFSDVFSWSIPFMMQNISDTLRALLKRPPADDHNTCSEEGGSALPLKGRSLATPAQQRSNTVEFQRLRKYNTESEGTGKFEIALHLDKANEALPSPARPLSMPMRRVHSMPELPDLQNCHANAHKACRARLEHAPCTKGSAADQASAEQLAMDLFQPRWAEHRGGTDRLQLRYTAAPLRDPLAIAARPSLERRALTMEGARKDWFRLLHKVSQDAISARDVSLASHQQLWLLLPVLLQLEHVADMLAARLRRTRGTALRAAAYALMRASPATAHPAHLPLFAELTGEWSASLEFYESIANAVVQAKPLVGATYTPQPEAAILFPMRPAPAPRSPQQQQAQQAQQILQIVQQQQQASHPSDDDDLSSGPPTETPRAHLLRSMSASSGLGDDDDDLGPPLERLSKARVLKVFNSGHSPTLLELLPEEGSDASPIRVLLKPDTVQSEAMTCRVFELFNFLWRHSWIPAQLKPVALAFDALPCGSEWGFVEFVPDAVSLRDYDFSVFENELTDEQVAQFVRTAAGGLVAGYALGIRDRHQDNFMVVGRSKFMQIDFKHCFDRSARLIDAPCFAVPAKMKAAFEKRNCWPQFKEIASHAFCCLRRSSGLIISLCCALWTGIEPQKSVEEALLAKLQLNVTEEKAAAYIPAAIEAGVRSPARFLKNLVHDVSVSKMDKHEGEAAAAAPQNS
eukprot:m51a1_g6680 hypothetical protein (1058) ;mRNA; f:224584-228901